MIVLTTSITFLFILSNTAVSCPVINDPPDGRIHQPDRSYLAVATVVCDEGYIRLNESDRVCQGNNTWSGKAGSCLREYTSFNLMCKCHNIALLISGNIAKN